MKIMQTTAILPYKTSYTTEKSVQNKHSAGPCFRGNIPSGIAEKILNDPELNKKFMTLVGSGVAAAVVALISSSLNKGSTDSANHMEISDIFTRNSSADEKDAEIARLKEENKQLKEFFAEQFNGGRIDRDNPLLRSLQEIELPRKPLSDLDCIKNSIIENNDAPGTFIFRIPGRNKFTTEENLKMLLKHFEDNVLKNTTETIRWRCTKSVTKDFNKEEILHELDETELKSGEPYNNVTKERVDLIADIIKSDERFTNLFSLHGALRFFERYIDFDSDNVEKQVKDKLDALEQLIRKSASSKGIFVDTHTFKDGKGRVITGARATMDPSIYDKEIIEQLGSYPVRLGIGENQSNPNYYEKKNKRPLICTIFSRGVS